MVLDIDLKDGELEKKSTFEEKVIQSSDGSNRSEQSVDKPTPPKKNKKKIFVKVLLVVLLLLILGGIAFAMAKGYKISKDVGFKFSPINILAEKEPELKKDSTGKTTSVLLVGVDSRTGSDISNTDTIIVMTYNYDSNSAILLSIPRDFHVEVTPNTKWYGRINSVYAAAEKKEEGTGFDALSKAIEDVTGIEIQYYAMVDFKAFVEIVDLLGGVNINVENSFIDYAYPKGLGYQTVKFVAGPQTMDGDTALKYARSRHSSQNNEGTDYARARRQQKVIIALQEKFAQNETLKDPKAVMGLLSSLVNNVKISEFTITDIQAALNALKEFKDENGQSYSFVLDPYSGGKELVETKSMPSGAFAIGPKEGLGVYTKIHEYLKLASEKPKLYSENPLIYVHDIGLGYKETQEKVKELREQFKYIQIIQLTTLFKDKEDTYVYSLTEKYPEAVREFSEYFQTTNTTKPDFIKRNAVAEGVIILLGKPIQLDTSEQSEI